MKAKIKHEIRGRLRISLPIADIDARRADMILYYLYSFEGVSKVKVYERTADIVICF